MENTSIGCGSDLPTTKMTQHREVLTILPATGCGPKLHNIICFISHSSAHLVI
jgi:hypothetical protein